MARTELDERMENLQHRVKAVEQILPTLATKTDLDEAIAPLATRAELAAAIAPLATKAELAAAIAPLVTKTELQAAIREEGERTRHYIKVITETLGDQIRGFADGVIANQQRIDAARVEFRQADEQLDRRVSRLEAARRKRR